MGGRQARRAEGRRAAMDAWVPVGSEGPFRAVPAVLLGYLELLQERSGSEELACPSLDAIGGREDGRSERRIRPAIVCQVHGLQDLGRGRAAQGHALSLSKPIQ